MAVHKLRKRNTEWVILFIVLSGQKDYPFALFCQILKEKNMGISTAGLIRSKHWALLIRTLPIGETNFKLKSMKDAKSLRVIVNREKKSQSEILYQMVENDLAITIRKSKVE